MIRAFLRFPRSVIRDILYFVAVATFALGVTAVVFLALLFSIIYWTPWLIWP